MVDIISVTKLRALTKRDMLALADAHNIELPASVKLKKEIVPIIEEKLDDLDLLVADEGATGVQMQLQIAKLQLELEQLKGTNSGEFDIKEASTLVPEFDEKSPDLFFEQFERVAKKLNWPPNKLPLLYARRHLKVGP